MASETSSTASPYGRQPPTGARINRDAIAGITPVTVVTRADLLASGKTTLAEVLQRLTINTNGINIQTNAGGDGTARINLRGLGNNATLVLLNGRRFVGGGDGVNLSVDLNAIPLSIVDRIEILKDGASPVYGSEAIAGVVNIITRQGFSGVEASAYTNLSERNDARLYQIDAMAGVTSNQGSIFFSVMFLDQQPVFATDRNFSDTNDAFDFGAYDAAGRPDDFERFINRTAGNSSASPQGNIIDRLNAPGNTVWESTGCAGRTCNNDPELGWTTGLPTFNAQPGVMLVTPSRRMSLHAEGQYQVSSNFEVFFESSFTNRVSKIQRATPALLTFSNNLVVSAENRFNPFGRNFTDVRRRIVEAGNRNFTRDSNTFRTVFGARGPLPMDGWHWTAYGNFGRTETTIDGRGRFNRNRLERALGPDAECTDGCVQLDVFGGQGSITPEMLDYIGFVAVERGFSEQNIVAGDVTGPLFELVDGHPAALSLGYQFQKEVGADIPDAVIASDEALGASDSPTEGRFEMHAGHAELLLPLARNESGVQRLDLHGAGRIARYDTFGAQATGEVGLRWDPISHVGLRGSISMAFRTPTISELQESDQRAVASASDPCAGALDNPTVAANCGNEGLGDGVNDGRIVLPVQVGGSAALEPETATVYTVGIVLEDSLFKGLSASVDYYNINVDDAIQALSANLILDRCYGQDRRQFCDRVRRLGTGTIDVIDTRLTNVGGFSASGIDFELRFRRPTARTGYFDFGLDGSILTNFARVLPNSFEQSFKGNYDAGFANPNYRLNAYLRWALGITHAGINFRFIPGVTECGIDQSTVPCQADRSTSAPVERPVGDYVYLDLFAGIDIDTFFGHSKVTLGVNNLTDAEPPFIAGGFTTTSDERLYDFVGRQYYARLIQTF